LGESWPMLPIGPKQTSLAILSSLRCPGGVIIVWYDLARELRDSGVTFVGGFQSPLERDFLDILLRGTPQVVVCPAQSTTKMRIPVTWKPHIADGRLTISSPFPDSETRSRRDLAQRRNRYVADMADSVLIGYATPGGAVDRLVHELVLDGKPVLVIDDPANAPLIEQGARPVNAETLMPTLEEILETTDSADQREE
jgi:hypothetical protein